MTRHGFDGWVLEDMEWEPMTGVARFKYSHTLTGAVTYECRAQPTEEGHALWDLMCSLPHETLSL